MIPVSLTIKGLYSYQNQQTIAFSRLLDSQLFGIFGSVGSGKSSILEAMAFALYGQSERLDRNDNRNYNMMNLRSDELLIDFIFKNFDDVEYRFTVRGKRHGKDFEKVNTFERAAYKNVSGEWLPLESSMADEILGLSYDNFRRTIIIPQGKFQEFLQLGDKDRTQMLKEIFQLDKYEFFYQTAALEKKNNENIQHLTGRLAAFEQVNAESVEDKEKTVRELGEKMQKHKARLYEKGELLKEQENLKKLFDELEKEQKQLDALLAAEERYNLLAKKINDYEFCLHHFKEGLKRKKELQLDIEKRRIFIHESNAALSQHTERLVELEKNFEHVKKEYQRLDEWRQILEDYQRILVLSEIKAYLAKLNERKESGLSHVAKAFEQKTADENRVAVLKDEIKSHKNEQPDMSMLSALRTWYLQKKNYKENIQNIKNEINRLKLQINTLTDSVQSQLNASVFNAVSGKTFLHYTEQVQQLRTENKIKYEALNAQIAHYTLQLKLGEFADQLSSGNPCILCGSAHHPQVLIVDNVHEQLLQANKKAEQFSRYDEACEQIIQVLHVSHHKEQDLSQQIESLRHKLSLEEIRLNEHYQSFKWEGRFDPENDLMTEEYFTEAEARSKKISALEDELETAEKSYKTSADIYEKFQKAVDQIKFDIAAKTAEEDTLKRQLKILELSEYEHFTEVELEQNIKNQEQKIESVKSAFDQLTKEINDQQALKVALFERINANRESLEKEELQLEKTEGELKERLEKSDFHSWDAVQQVLNEELDIEDLKKQVLTYKQQLYSSNKTVSQLKEQVSGKLFSIEIFKALVEELEELAQVVQTINDEYVKEKESLNKQQADLQQKLVLLNELNKLQKRATNLNTMKQLFKGSGFVNYVSSVYLHNLCEAANERFYKLSRQSLRLEVTDRNEFQVRDFLNNGKVRNVKTLSGGQTFQASLSLALALAESIQQQNRSRQNFFFMDEGFGSLDKESLQVAFETLKSLRKENRIVGIISHVEELQQEIDVFLHIINEPHTGSRIKSSWE